MASLDKMVSLGPCCLCETTEGVRNILSLRKKCPIPGRGWGCCVCGVPPDGALAVFCDECMGRIRSGEAEPRFACRGYPARDGRVPIGELTGEHKHVMSRHPAWQRFADQ